MEPRVVRLEPPSRNESGFRSRRAHHLRRHFYHEAAWSKAFSLEHHTIEGAGDDIGFPAREGFQADARNFVGCFSDTHRTVGLLCHLLEFSLSGTRAEGADAHTELTYLFSDSLREEEVERLCGCVHRQEWHGLERGGRTDDQDVATPPGDHCGKIQPCKVHDCG